MYIEERRLVLLHAPLGRAGVLRMREGSPRNFLALKAAEESSFLLLALFIRHSNIREVLEYGVVVNQSVNKYYICVILTTDG